ncbi:MAG: hypothetical protein V2B14_06580 [bacterium]
MTFFLKIIIILFISNILSMVLMNVFVVKTDFLVCVYMLSIAISTFLTNKINIKNLKNSTIVFSKKEKIFISVFFILLFLAYIMPRLVYVLEPKLGYIADALGDDIGHIPELNSLINSERYPPVSSFFHEKYLSYYYAPWMFMAFIYYILPFSFVTAKMAYFIGYSVYILLILYLAFYFCLYLSKNKKQFYILIYLTILYSGIDSILIFLTPFRHNEWWMRDFFGLNFQISSFSTCILWSAHALIAAFSLIIPYFLYINFLKLNNFNFKNRIIVYIVISLLLVNALYSNTFVVLGALPFIIYFIFKNLKNYRDFIWIFAASLIFSSGMFWIFLGREIGEMVYLYNIKNFGFNNYQINFTLSLLLFACLVFLELVIYFWVLAKEFKKIKENKNDFILVLLSIGFIFFAFLVGYKHTSNNLALRGLIIPLFVLAYITSKCFISIKFSNKGVINLFFILSFLSLGSINEIFYFNNLSKIALNFPKKSESKKIIYALNTNRNIKSTKIKNMLLDRGLKLSVETNQYNIADYDYHLFFLTEKIVSDYSLKKQDNEDYYKAAKELTNNGPFFIWSYQDWKNNAKSDKS